MTGEQIVARYDELKSERGVFESHWQECTDYALPRKSNITRSVVPGEKKGQTVLDSTAIQANELLAGALHGMLTNPTTLWFELTTGDQALDAIQEVKDWLQKTSNSIHAGLNDSNFQTEIHEVYIDEGTIGTSAMFIADDEDTLFRFKTYPVTDVVFDENNKGVVDEVYRLFKWTAKQIVQQFGKDGIDKEILDKAKENKPDKFELIHCVYPRDQMKVDPIKRKGPYGYPFASKYVLKKTKKILSESGYQEWPWVTPRWTVTAGEKYGRSPTMKCLADIKMLNAMAKTVIEGAQKAVSPPLSVPDDSYIGPITTKPNGLNYRRAGSQDHIEPFGNDCRIDYGQAIMNDARMRIKEAFYIDQLQLNQGPQMTATEVMQRTEEKLRLLGPILGRQQSELLRPMIDRIFGIMARKGKLPKPIPEQVKGKLISVKYSSLVARAQRVSEGQNIARAIQAATPFLQIDPAVADNFAGDEGLRYIFDIFGIPAKLMKPEQEVKKIREARAQAQQQQMQMQMQQQQAQAMGQAAPAVQAMAQMQKGGNA